MEQAAAAVARHPDWTSGNRCSHVAVGNSVTSQPEALRANPLGDHSDGCIPGPLLEISSWLGMAAVSGDATPDWSACSGIAPAVWAWSLMAGFLGLAASIGLYIVAHRLVRWPAAAAPDFSKSPAITIFATLLMSAIVAGFSEEAGFRGYMQGPLEHRYGPASAILITSVIFGLVHLSHGVFVPAILFDIVWGAFYGLLAWRSGSIVPALVLHSAADFLEFVLVWKLPRRTPAPLVWQSTPNALFWIDCALVVVASAASVWAFRRLGRLHDDSSRESLETV